MKYRIIECSSSSKLEIKVNAAMEQGWKPIGGVCSELLYGYIKTVYQAMILGDEDE